MIDIWDKIKFSYFFVKGSRLLSKENIIEALVYFTKASKCEYRDYNLYAYKGLCEFLLHKYENSIWSYQMALQLIENKQRLNIDEKEYLKHYVLRNLILALDILNKNENIDEYQLILKNSFFDIAKVRDRYIEDFPLDSK